MFVYLIAAVFMLGASLWTGLKFLGADKDARNGYEIVVVLPGVVGLFFMGLFLASLSVGNLADRPSVKTKSSFLLFASQAAAGLLHSSANS